MKHFITSVLAILALGPFADADAQGQRAAIEPGQHVRVTTQPSGGESLVGVLVRLTRDSVVILPDGGVERVTIALATVDRFERTRARPGLAGAMRGAGIGAIGGALMAKGAEGFADANQPGVLVYGAVAGGLLGVLPGAGGWPVARWTAVGLGGGILAGGVIGVAAKPEGDISTEDAALLGAGLLGLIGYAIGTVAGYQTSRWEQVSLDRLRVSIAPTGGAGVGINLTFFPANSRRM